VIGHLSVTELKPRHFIDLLKGIEGKGLLEVASRTRQHLSNIMRHAVHQGLIEAATRRQTLARCRDAPARQTALSRLAVLLTLHLFIRSSDCALPAGQK
jgi:hypothetical protein